MIRIAPTIVNFSYLFLILIITIQNSNQQVRQRSKKCPGLTFNGQLECYHLVGNLKITKGCAESQDVGTVVNYKCNPHFTHYDATGTGGLSSLGLGHAADSQKGGVLQCRENGTWAGYSQFKNWRCKEDCGRRIGGNSNPFITNAVFTNSTSWPWHATIFKRIGNKTHYICGGTVIRRTAVLLAAHCVVPIGGISTAAENSTLADSFVVVLGAISSNFNENLEAGNRVQIFNVSKFFVVDSYDPRKDFQGDIAIIQLSKKIEYNQRVSPACLPTDFLLDSNALRPGQSGDVIGFGVDENGKLSQTLKYGKVEINSYSECFVQLHQRLSESQFCAGGQTEKGFVTVCNGDSGGGLFIPSTIDEKFYVHGIVSSGDSNTRKGLCQNYGVFTRVFSFIPWIREVLVGMSSDSDADPSDDEALLQNSAGGSGIDFIQQGNDSFGSSGAGIAIAQSFNPIPLEWKNKVTTINLAFINIDPQILLNSLDYTKTVQNIILKQVRFTKSFPKRAAKVRLPRLQSIYMDIIHPELDSIYSKTLKFPQQSKFKKFIKSLKFFEKDVGKESAASGDITRIAQGNVNVYLGIGIFKLIQVDHQEGKITLSQIDFAQEILENILQDSFNLRHLALSSCTFDTSILASRKELKSLILDKVTLVSGQWSDLDSLVLNARQLEELTLVPVPQSRSLTIKSGNLPRTLKHLALTKIILDMDQSGGVRLEQLKTFFCDSCFQNISSIRKLARIFPNLKQIVVKLNELPTDDLLKDFVDLESAIFITGQRNLRLSKISGKWIPVEPTRLQNWNLEETHLIFWYNRFEHFWNSEADFACSVRLSPPERNAYESGTYKFKGILNPIKVESFSLEPNGFSTIPSKIQSLLHVVELEDVILTSSVVQDAFKFCPNLKTIRFTNVQIPDMVLWQSIPFPKLEEFQIKTTLPGLFLFFGFHGLARSSDLGFVLLFIPEERNNPGFSARTSLLRSKLKIIHMQYGPCIGVSWNKETGKLISSSGYTNMWLKSGTGSETVPIKKFSLKYNEVDPQVLPATITHLNLNFVVLKSEGSSTIFSKLKTLKDLRFINVRAGTNGGNLVEWPWANLDLGQLAKFHSKSLEYFAVERANLINYKEGIQFENVTFAYIESCKFDANFSKNFLSVFPKLKRLVILGSSGNRILLEILKKNKRTQLDWIFSRTDTAADNLELKKLFQSFRIPENKNQYFILKNIGNVGNWVQGNLSRSLGMDETQIKGRLLKLKGTAEFGADAKCHGYNLDSTATPGFWGRYGYAPGSPRISLRALIPFLPKSLSSNLESWLNS